VSCVVLGVNLGHDRSACMAVDGQPRVAIAEERLSRLKHDIPLNARGERRNFFPRRAVSYCLDACGLGFADINLVVASTTYVADEPGDRRRNLNADDIRWQCPELADTRVEVVLHHLAHAASAALCSGWPSAAVLVADGGGSIVRHDGDTPRDFERTTLFRLRDGTLETVRRTVGGPPAYGNSLGDFYQAITTYLGFRTGEEGKTMGLAGYRDMADAQADADWAPLSQFKDAILVSADGGHRVSEVFQFTAEGGHHPSLIDAFGPPRPKAQPGNTLDRHIAASAQWALEEAMLELARAAGRLTGERCLCLAGGVALNCVANSRILHEGPFNELFIQPAAGDDGTALGNALLGTKMLTGRGTSWKFENAYLGRDYTAGEVMAVLEQHADRVRVERPDAVADAAAEDIAAGRITAVFRGGAEYGPRALAHRSILADPRLPWMKDHLNERVKHRESFRPFAPMVLDERAARYFDLSSASPYMLLAADVLCPEAVPAITHVDGSARVQTVGRDSEPFLHAMISAFERRTGVAVLLNTSFNDQEPIVETPEDAMRCFLDTGIDVLYLDGHRVLKEDQEG
jgi:carbamoyltransferase